MELLLQMVIGTRPVFSTIPTGGVILMVLGVGNDIIMAIRARRNQREMFRL